MSAAMQRVRNKRAKIFVQRIRKYAVAPSRKVLPSPLPCESRQLDYTILDNTIKQQRL